MFRKAPAYAAFLLLAGILCPSSLIFSQELPVRIAIQIPDISFDLDDLDARDAQNRPIRSLAQRAQFRRLFVQSLHDALIRNLTPGRRDVLLQMARSWHDFSGWLKAAMDQTVPWIDVWFSDKKIRSLVSFPVKWQKSHQNKPSHLIRSFWSDQPTYDLVFLILASTQLLR